MKLNIAYFYQKELNLYGDTGNVEILYQRAKRRGITVSIYNIDSSTKLNNMFFESTDIVFMGGGPDSGQKRMYEDLLKNKKEYLKEYVERGGVALFICGAYQLMGHYYKSADNSILQGLGIFDLYTRHFGHHKPRCVGNTVAKLNKTVLEDPVFTKINTIGNTIVGFENHGGRTYLNEGLDPMAVMTAGHGNNSEDNTEGIHFKNAFGTYFHGPFLSKNPHVADYLIAKSLKLEKLEKLDDTIVKKAHSALINRFK